MFVGVDDVRFAVEHELLGEEPRVVKWVTVGNGTRVGLCQWGRVLVGGPAEWRGVHVSDLAVVLRKVRAIETEDCAGQADRAATRETGRPTFPSKAAGRAALEESNPRLAEWLQAEWDGKCQDYLAWASATPGKGTSGGELARGARGAKPQKTPGDGRWDPVDVWRDLRGGHRCSCALEAVYLCLPASKRWADADRGLEVLAEVTGFPVAPPTAAAHGAVKAQFAEACEESRPARAAAVLEDARATRVDPAASPAEVPF